jgi:hypothetical protein
VWPALKIINGRAGKSPEQVKMTWTRRPNERQECSVDLLEEAARKPIVPQMRSEPGYTQNTAIEIPWPAVGRQ